MRAAKRAAFQISKIVFVGSKIMENETFSDFLKHCGNFQNIVE